MSTITTANLKKLVEDLIRLYTINHEYLTVEPIEMNTGVVINVQTESADHRKMVGKGGANIVALKSVFENMGKALGVTIAIELQSPKPVFSKEMADETKYPEEQLQSVLKQIAEWTTQNTCTITMKKQVNTRIYTISEEGPAPVGISQTIQANLQHLASMVGNKHRQRIYLDFGQ